MVGPFQSVRCRGRRELWSGPDRNRRQGGWAACNPYTTAQQPRSDPRHPGRNL